MSEVKICESVAEKSFEPDEVQLLLSDIRMIADLLIHGGDGDLLKSTLSDAGYFIE